MYVVVVVFVVVAGNTRTVVVVGGGVVGTYARLRSVHCEIAGDITALLQSY